MCTLPEQDFSGHKCGKNVIDVEICTVVVLPELYPFRPLSDHGVISKSQQYQTVERDISRVCLFVPYRLQFSASIHVPLL